MFIDIHAHLNDKRLIDDLENVILRAEKVNVGKIVCVGADYESSKLSVDLANRYSSVYATIGIHPHSCLEFDEKMENLILESGKNNKVIAVGEIGLDYYDLDYQILQAIKNNPSFKEISKNAFIEKQKTVFLRQIDLAKKVGLPVMLHMRDAAKDTLTILKENESSLKNGGLLHCYNGSLETTKILFDLGFYISIGGAITFKNAQNMPDVLREIGISRVMLETDCPYLSPEPFRGKLNEPQNIPIIARKIAEITNTDIKEVETITTENCYKLFSRLKNE